MHPLDGQTFKDFIESLHSMEQQRVILFHTAIQLKAYVEEQDGLLGTAYAEEKVKLRNAQHSVEDTINYEEEWYMYVLKKAEHEGVNFFKHPKIPWILGIFIFIFLEFICFAVKMEQNADLTLWINLLLPLLITLVLITLPYFCSVAACKIRYERYYAKEKADYPNYCNRNEQTLAELRQFQITVRANMNSITEQRDRLEAFLRSEMALIIESLELLEGKIEELYLSLPTFPRRYQFDFKEVDELKRFFEKVGYDSMAKEMLTEAGYDDTDQRRIILREKFFEQLAESSAKVQYISDSIRLLKAETQMTLREIENQYDTEIRVLENQCRNATAAVETKIEKESMGFYRDTLAFCLAADAKIKRFASRI